MLANGFRLTSPPDVSYNCLAWAAGANDAWWDPSPGYYWPDHAPRNWTVESLIKAYEAHGFSKCADGSLESGYEKIALYGDPVGYTHAARQLSTGKWASKIGTLEDIEHAKPECLEGASYGRVVQFMRRRTTRKSSG